MSPSLLIASHNKGKAKEIAYLLQQFDLTLKYSWEIPIPEVEETGSTFIENALLKARSAVEETGLPTIADDCGLELEFLSNEPGIHSKRYAQHLGSWENAMWNFVERLEGEDTTAYFSCAIAMAWPSGDSLAKVFRLKGRFVSPRGRLGFGFDPCFLPDNSDRTLGEIEPGIRNKINHRAKAFELLSRQIDWIHCRPIGLGYSQGTT